MEDKRVKIAYIISSSEIGGTEKMLLLMLENLTRQNFRCPVVFAIKGKGKFTEELGARGIKTRIFNLKTNPLLFISLVKAVKHEAPDIIHSFLFYGNLAGRICGRLLKTKTVISSQRSVDSWRKWYHWKIDRLTSKWSDIIISNSFAGKQALVEKARISPGKIIVIPNGISSGKLKCTIDRKSLGLKTSDTVIGAVGNLRKAKGHIYLVKAAEIVLKQFPDAAFVIAGEGELGEYLAREAKRRGIESRFTFTGFRSDVEELIQLFDIFVLPSLWEGFPVSLLEAMKYGKPVIAFGVADVPYIIEDGKSGFVVPVKDYGQLASKIKFLIKNNNLREQAGKQAEKRLGEKFSLKLMLKRYVSVYMQEPDKND